MYGLIATYLITAISSLAALRYPLIGLYAYVGFAVLRPQFIFSFAGDLSNVSFILGVALLIGWVLNGLGSWRTGRARAVVVMLFVYTAAVLISASLAEFKDASYLAVLELLKIVLPFCVGLTMMNEERQWRPLLWVILLAQGYVGFEMNLDYLRGYNRAAEGFGGMDNNCFGVSLVTVLGVAIALVMTSRKWYEQAAAATCAALILHTTLLTFSRGAMVGMIAVGFAAFLALPKRPKYIAVMAVVALVAIRLTGPQLLARYSTVVASDEQRDGSAQSRIDLWKDALQVIAAQPVLGVGPANWRLIAHRFGWTPGKSAHSVWMETAAEIGVPGTLGLLLFFVLAILKLWPLARARVTDENHSRVGAAMAVMLGSVGFVVSGQFVSVVGLEAPYYLVMVGIALLREPALEPTLATAGAIERVTETGAPVVVRPQGQSSRARPTPTSEAGRRRLLPDLRI